MLQHKVDTEEDLFYALLFHMCVVHCARSQTIWQVNSAVSGTGLLLLFHQFFACK